MSFKQFLAGGYKQGILTRDMTFFSGGVGKLKVETNSIVNFKITDNREVKGYNLYMEFRDHNLQINLKREEDYKKYITEI